MQIAVIGTGYVGLVAGTCFAQMGNHIQCVDIDEAKVERLKQGHIPIYEPGLEEMVVHNHRDGRLLFTTDLAAAVAEARVVFIAVGTPPGEDGSADLSAVLGVAKAIGKAANGPKLIVNKSTVPVGTAALVLEAAQAETDHSMEVVSNPEFLKEGAAIDDFLKPDRVVIGASSEEAFELMEELYSPFLLSGKPLLRMDPASAELTKYAANAMLATRISFMNEIAQICDRVGANVDQVRKGIGSDRRIGSPFLFPGIGYGGSCFPKDVKAIMATARQHDYVFQILEAVETVNENQKTLMAEKIVSVFGEDLSGRTFGVWGLAFKPNTDDMREAAAVPLIQSLLQHGATVRAYDPEATETAQEILGDSIEYCSSALAAVEGADALILCTEWGEFRRPGFEKLGQALKRKLIFDGRNIYDAKEMRKYGFERHGVGVPLISN